MQYEEISEYQFRPTDIPIFLSGALEEEVPQVDQGNLLRGIDNCSGAALKAVRQLLTTSFINNFLYLNF